jgi:hypothetical protein
LWNYLAEAPMETVVGRQEELALLQGLVVRSPISPAALILEGEIGIGKTTLWKAGVAAAQRQSLQVLTARPAEAERTLGYAALGDLLESVLEELLPALPRPRRRALEVALLLAEPEGQRPDARAIGVAVLASLRALAERKRVLLAVDDVQWMDASSAATVEFALRRVGGYPVLTLLTRRLGEEGPAPERALPPESVTRRELGALTLGAIHQLLLGQLGRAFTRPTLLRIHETSGGNPFLALELARALARTDTPLAPGEPLPVPETLEALVRDRLDALPERARSVLVAAAALADPKVQRLQSGWPDAAESLETARRADVITIEGDRVRFTHPLLASVLLEQAPADRRRGLHARLAELVEDPVEHARHLALAADIPDPVIAERLDRAAATARAGGALLAAADLGELAVRATPGDQAEQNYRRTLQASRDLLAAGAADRARSLGQELLTHVRAGPVRAEALLLLSEVEGDEGLVTAEVELLRAALEEARGTPELELVIELRLGNAIRFREGTDAGLVRARAALELAERLGDDASYRGRSQRSPSSWSTPAKRVPSRRPNARLRLPPAYAVRMRSTTLCGLWAVASHGRGGWTRHAMPLRRRTRRSPAAMTSSRSSFCGSWPSLSCVQDAGIERESTLRKGSSSRRCSVRRIRTRRSRWPSSPPTRATRGWRGRLLATGLPWLMLPTMRLSPAGIVACSDSSTFGRATLPAPSSCSPQQCIPAV